MKILRGDVDNVDFPHPLEMSQEQIKQFVKLLESMFYTVTEEEIKSFRTERMGEKLFAKEWDATELELIFKIDEVNEEICKKLGRTWMSVDMKRGSWIPMLLQDAKRKGVDLYKADIKKFIQDFLKEHEDELLKRKQERKEKRDKDRNEREEFERLKEEIPKFETLVGISGMPTKEKLEEMRRRLEELREILEDSKI